MLTVGILHGNAYGLNITDELEKQTGRKIMISSVHKTLVRLEDKGYLKSYRGGSTKIRGGREKRLYELTETGVLVLNKTRDLRNTMWRQVPEIVWRGGSI